MKRFLAKNPGRRIIIVVPTDALQRQWLSDLTEQQVPMVYEVLIINSVVKHEWTCDLLVLDECHKYASDLFGKVFEVVKYKIILGLTATMERLDGKDSYIKKYCPVVDRVDVSEATARGWLSPYREYKVMVEVDNLDKYYELNREFYEHFAFFGHDFTLAMACATKWQKRIELAKTILPDFDKKPDEWKALNKTILIHAMGFNRTLQARKKFIYEHPKKIELTNMILEHRQDKKCITFSKTIKIAEQIKYGKVLSSKETKKKGRMTLEEFKSASVGVLNTSKMLDEGADIPGLSVAVILGYDSSPTSKTQRIGRVIRKAENKVAEVFTLVIKGTVEEEWFRKSTGSKDYITLADSDLLNLLEGREFTPKKNKETKMIFRF
jgi:superfamily II DNA or RNA helicase